MRRLMAGFVMALFVGAALGAIGCSGKEAATAAVDAAQASFNAVKGDAVKVLPDETQKLSDALATARTDIDQGKIKEAMDAAKAMPDQVKQLADAAAKRKDELTASWNSVSAELPKAVDAVQEKVDALSKDPNLPAGLDATTFAGIKESLTVMKQTWADAQAEFQGGDLAAAIAKVGTIKQALASAMPALHLEIPAALKVS